MSTRTSTRLKRGETAPVRGAIRQNETLVIVPSQLKARSWHKKMVKVGHFEVPKWVPVSQLQPTIELQSAAASKSKSEYNSLTRLVCLFHRLDNDCLIDRARGRAQV
jgi:hypothetical protein